MFRREEVERILEQARRMDPQLEMFGVSEHQYKLGSPVDLTFVRSIEEKYHFRFPEDYVQFITEVGDGGAGPGYGLYPFSYYCTEAESAKEANARKKYLHRLGRELRLLPIEPEWLDNGVLYGPYGFFHLGTHGCWRDFGLVTAGERYGQVFIYDTEGAFELAASSFQAFYQDWLDFILDTKRFQKELDEWKRVRNR